MRAKQLVVVSGKGGTGKTTVLASLACLAEKSVLADCDVDAPDLHLLLQPEVLSEEDFQGLKLARIDEALCTGCGLCREHCRFSAISEDLRVDQAACEGCGVCSIVCPEGAAELGERVSGWVYSSTTRFGRMAHARLRAGEEASGKLVSRVRTLAESMAEEGGEDLIMIDGPPGIGCPVIAAMSGVDAALVVAEPTMSGRQGMERAVEVAQHFGVPALAVVNKADLDPEGASSIEAWCAERGVRVVARLPYDPSATDAMLEGRTVVEHADGPLARAIAGLWRELRNEMGISGRTEEGAT